MAGWTVSFIAAPVEHVKARLQIQYAADKSKRLYSGPIDCTKKLVRMYYVPLGGPQAHSSCNSFETMASQVSTMVFPQLSSSVLSFSSGGALTTFSHVFSLNAPRFPRLQSISGQADYRRKYFG